MSKNFQVQFNFCWNYQNFKSSSFVRFFFSLYHSPLQSIFLIFQQNVGIFIKHMAEMTQMVHASEFPQVHLHCWCSDETIEINRSRNFPKIQAKRAPVLPFTTILANKVWLERMKGEIICDMNSKVSIFISCSPLGSSSWINERACTLLFRLFCVDQKIYNL